MFIAKKNTNLTTFMLLNAEYFFLRVEGDMCFLLGGMVGNGFSVLIHVSLAVAALALTSASVCCISSIYF